MARKVGGTVWRGRLESFVLPFVLPSAREPREGARRTLVLGLGLLPLAILAGLPLLSLGWMSGHDTYAYLPRIVEFYQGLAAGEISPRWAADFNGGYGEPSFNYLPPLLYYVAAPFYGLTHNVIAAEDVGTFALLLLAAVGMYLLAAEFFGSYGGLVAATAYLVAPYFQVNLYIRHALADFSAYAFIPLAFWGIYRFTLRWRYRYLLVGTLASALLLLSSNPIALVTYPFLGALVCLVALYRRSLGGLARGVACLGIALGLTAYFWLPALVERGYVQLGLVVSGYYDYHAHFVYPFQLVVSTWGYGASEPGPNDGFSFRIGYVHLVVLVLAPALIWLGRRALRRTWPAVAFFVALGVAAAFLTTYLSQPIWEAVSLLQYLQCPWRILSLVVVGTAFLCGLPLVALGSDRAKPWIAVAMIGALLAVNLVHSRPLFFQTATPDQFSPANIAKDDVGHTVLGEYTPVWVAKRPSAPASGPATFLEGSGDVSAVRLSPEYRDIVVTAAVQSRVRLDTFYVPGWTVYVDGSPRPAAPSSPEGVMELTLAPGRHEVVAVLEDTPVRRWASVASLLSLVVLLVAWALPRLRQTAGRRDPLGAGVAPGPGE